MNKQITKTSGDELKELMQSVSDPDPDKKITATILSMATDEAPPDTITPELLAGAKKKVDNLEFARPDMAKDPEKLGTYITWNYETASAYRDYILLLSLQISSNAAEGSDYGSLKKDLELVQKRLKALDADKEKAWNLFRDLKEGRKADHKVIAVNDRPLEEFLTPLDKVSLTLWTRGEIDGKEDFEIRVEKAGSSKEISIPLQLNMTAVQERYPQLRRLDSIDKRIWSISDALFRNGQDIVSYNQIYKYIGHANNENGKNREIIDNAYTKLNAEIYFDNQQEIDAGYHYKHFKYTGPILANERIESDGQEIIINGNRVDSAIHILNKSRLLDFAIDRREGGQHGQVAALPIGVYQTPLKFSVQNAELEDYILTWLIRALDSNKPADRVRKMETIYKKFHVTGKRPIDRKRRERLKDKIIALLYFYKKLQLSVKGRALESYEMTDELRLIIRKVDG